MNPFRFSFLRGKAGVPNFDPAFNFPFPMSFLEGGNVFSQMRTKPGINHPWVYAAITTIIDSYVQCPLRLKKKGAKAGNDDLIDTHPILDLLANPNPHMSGTNFLEMIVWALSLPSGMGPGGACFIFGGDGENFSKGEMPDELWLQGANGVRPVLNNQKILNEWCFTYTESVSPYNYGSDFRLEPQQVLRVNYFNPYNHLQGVAPVHAVRSSVSMDADALAMNAARIRNGGQARGVFTSKKPMTAPQLQEFKENIRKFTEGVENDGKNMVLPWEMSYDQLTMNAEDMAYMETLGWDENTMRAALKVSKFALQQYEDLNYATAKEAKRQLFDQSILPLHARIMQHLNQGWILPATKGLLELTVDLSGVTALADDMDARYKRAQILVEMGVPPMIALKMQQIPTDDLKAFKWLMENQSATAAFKSDPADATDPAAKPQKPAKADPDPKPAGKGYRYRIRAVLTEEERSAMASAFLKGVFTPGEAGMGVAVRRFFNEQRNRLLDNVDAWAAAKGKKAVRKAEGDDTEMPPPSPFEALALESTFAAIVPDMMAEDIRLGAAMKPHYASQAQRAAQASKDRIEEILRHPVEIEIQHQQEQWIRMRLHSLSRVNRTTFKGVEDTLSEILAQANADEISIQDTAKRIKAGLSDVYDGRKNESMTIARTENGAVTGFINRASGVAAGMETHGWLVMDDEKLRDSHRECGHEGMIPISTPFVNGLMYPGESKIGPEWAKEVINCRCTEIFGMLPAGGA